MCDVKKEKEDQWRRPESKSAAPKKYLKSLLVVDELRDLPILETAI
jgi:hypothetical protein